MNCRNCGAKINDDSRFCSYCGKLQLTSAVPPVGKDIPNHMAEAILSAISCFPPFGVVAIYFAYQTDKFKLQGDFERARNASNSADFWWKFGVGVGVVLTIVAVIGMVAMSAPMIKQIQPLMDN